MRIHHATAAKARKFKVELTIEDNEVIATAKDGTVLATGLQANKVLEEAITKLTGHPAKKKAVKAATPKKARASKDEDGEEDEEGDEEEGDEEEAVEELEPEDDSEADQGKSLVKSKYKKLYKPHKDKCGDDLSERLNAHVSVKTEDGLRIDLKKLRKFAEANDCWVPAYASLKSRTGGWNAGMARMNVANRLRGKIRQAKKAGEEYEIVWA